jgi:hypothetical protein
MKRWWAPVGVAAVLIAAWYVSWYSSVSVKKMPGFQLPQPEQVLPTGPLVSVRPQPSSSAAAGHDTFFWLLIALLIVLCLIVLTLLIALVRLLLRSLNTVKPRLLVRTDKPGTAVQRGDEAEMLAAVDAGLAELSDTDADPRRAVIACWVRLERAAAAAGTPRELGDSPTDLVARLLGAHQVSRPVLSRFAGVYREARFTTHPIDDTMRDTAVGALRHLRAELASEVLHGGA